MGICGRSLGLSCDRYAPPFTTAMPPLLRPLCPPLRPLCPSFTTAMPPLYDRYAPGLRLLCPPCLGYGIAIRLVFLHLHLVFRINCPSGKNAGPDQLTQG